ncbi:MAG TPA: hypothetical protein VFL86_14415 [Burkholderiaceae bacterium]|nr:hypothetical protein [Burkholderiaceae bacterium]
MYKVFPFQGPSGQPPQAPSPYQESAKNRLGKAMALCAALAAVPGLSRQQRRAAAAHLQISVQLDVRADEAAGWHMDHQQLAAGPFVLNHYRLTHDGTPSSRAAPFQLQLSC